MSKKRGRPRLWGDRGTVVRVYIPTPLYESLRQIAENEDISVSAVARAAFRSFLLRKQTDTPSNA